MKKRRVLIMTVLLGAALATGCGASKEEKEALPEEIESTEEVQDTELEEADAPQKTEPDMLAQFYEQFYSGLSSEQMESRVSERTQYYQKSAYSAPVMDYLENVRGVRDIGNVMDPLYYTDMKYYSEEDFADAPQVVIHVAKNEIYAKHGYIFGNEDLQNYFMGCAWYEPVEEGGNFDDSVFNDYEKKNLEILAKLDQK